MTNDRATAGRRAGDLKVKLSQTEWRQIAAACERLRLDKTDLVRLALDDLFRGPRLQPRQHVVATRKPVPAIAA